MTPPASQLGQSAAGDLVVTAVGMVSPLGSDALQTFTSVRSGLRRMRERPDLYACLPAKPDLDPPEPLIASAIEHLDTRARRESRPAEWLALLAAEAFKELSRATPLGEAAAGVFLALPGRAPALGLEQRDELVYHFHNYAEHDLFPHFQLERGDATTALKLAEEAAALLRARRIDFAAVGAADSWLFRPWLEPADRDWQLLSDRNADGFQPGEAAAFFLLETAAHASRRGARPLAKVRGFSCARHDASRGIPNTGAELAGALEPLLPSEGTPLFVCDLNGVSARTREWAYALSRLGTRLEDGFAVEHPASVLGDVGTAAGASLVALAVRFLASKHSSRSTAVVWARSEDGERRAMGLDPVERG